MPLASPELIRGTLWRRSRDGVVVRRLAGCAAGGGLCGGFGDATAGSPAAAVFVASMAPLASTTGSPFR